MTGNSSETATEMRQSAILKPGENCWRIEQADRVSLLVDGAEYFMPSGKRQKTPSVQC
jgi:hypothetical protein